MFQDFNLIPVLTVFENVEYPLLLVQRWPVAERRKRVGELLDKVRLLQFEGKIKTRDQALKALKGMV